MLPAAWALLVTAILGGALANLSWPFVDLYNNLYKASAFSWPETLASAFAGGVEYRPLLIIGVKLVHQLVGLRVWVYQALVILQLAAILGGLIWIFQPYTRTRAAAACVALACVIGLQSSRVLFMFAPLNAHSFGVVLLLAAVILALSPRSPARELVFLPLTLVALLLLESGGLIVAVMLVLWRMRAPGASGRAVAGTLIGAAIYLAVRFGLGDQAATSTHAETGLGFTDVSAARLDEMFVHAPWLLWLYNVVASFLTVAASEPRAGKYLFIEAMLHGRVPPWMYVHVITSVVTSGIVVYVLTTSWIANIRDRQLAAAGATVLILGSALGFLYTRDRIALSAGVGYAMLVFVAVSALLQGLLQGRPKGRPLREPAEGRPIREHAEGRPRQEGGEGRPVRVLFAAICLAIAAAGWLVRTGEAYFQLRDAAWENRQEWTARFEELGGLTRPQTDMLDALQKEAIARVPDDPRRDPAWTYTVFQREFERSPAP
jgi:hypothetical protein